MLPKGVWFRAGNVCVSGVVDALPKRYTNRICEGHEDLPSYKAVLEAIKFEEKPSCVKNKLLKVSEFQIFFFLQIYIQSSPRAIT